MRHSTELQVGDNSKSPVELISTDQVLFVFFQIVPFAGLLQPRGVALVATRALPFIAYSFLVFFWSVDYGDYASKDIRSQITSRKALRTTRGLCFILQHYFSSPPSSSSFSNVKTKKDNLLIGFREVVLPMGFSTLFYSFQDEVLHLFMAIIFVLSGWFVVNGDFMLNWSKLGNTYLSSLPLLPS